MIPAFPADAITQIASTSTNVLSSMGGLIEMVLGLALGMLVMGLVMGFFGYYEVE